MRLYGVIGWKNAGKTGLMERLVAEVRARGFTVSTVKHTHHRFDLDQPGKDSFRHRAAGAREVLLASHTRWALLHELGDAAEPPLAEVLAKLAPVDLVLVEGYKRDSHPKVEVFREGEGRSLIQPDDPTVHAVACDQELEGLPVPLLDLNDTQAIVDFILAETGLAVRAPEGAGAACFEPPALKGMASVDAAQALLRGALSSVTGRETLALNEAAGRILAADAVAERANPPATNSAMDGFAFAHASLPESGEATLALVEGRSAAGAPYAGKVPPGHAVKILTGALMPDGADTVVMQERARAEGGVLRFDSAVTPAANTRAKGEDVAQGAVALAAGTRLGPGEIGLLAALGIGEVSVRKRLRVGVLSTGDELAAPGSTLDPARTFDANRPMLLALVGRWGHDAVDLGHVPDDRDTLRATFDKAAAAVDVLLTSGGASAGEEDHVSALLGSEGRVAQWRVALKPGKPLLLGDWRGLPLFGLPGNPVSAFVTALLFARPALSVLAGGDWLDAQGFSVPAAFAMTKRAGRREFLRARLTAEGRAELFRSDSSGMISSLAWAKGLVEIDEDAREIKAGDLVRYYPLGAFSL
ncbi:bifunctional molybdopterin-guanine dinucleotide biosynthesis adaptor protein MobB/molybdopterin molybdotransferase MoeA [Maritimibacter sp. HL-12]|uniref:bifunctional molybdopterin-guanine dinucleotide biosynthesis adaptor protein MobB/molybdopterin molybdotransferase MoeA n=1 Tax=Maritimibacter sp. HL-12 TaxID=1162418 RepID=UPI000A0F0F3A|nr:bifunctional molybdopterin-guanine dinucleotide biosynthesis adaptor protein MobB/molybdopterin molybdotransferase MoeA [Maritimibacter sp. HL-12]SMH40706.1 molybdopterin molybdochelatase /molybdopterin guanine dinucleotide biosynthesis accessory protein MobB [Maritimibacter sp. HL-12]